MIKSQSNRWKYFSFLISGILIASTILGWQQVDFPLKSVYGAGTITNVFVSPSANIFNTNSYYTISFNTATAGIIKSIEITFPAGFNIVSAKLMEIQGIGTGSATITGQTLKYSVSSPVLVPASKSIKIMISDVINSVSPSSQVSVVTKDNSINSAIIDGPTKSTAFTLTPVTNAMIGTNAVTSTKMGSDSVDTSKIKNNQVTLADMAPNSVNSTKIVDNSIGKQDMNTDFFKKITLIPNTGGWNPDGIRKIFGISDTQVSPTSIILTSVNHGEAGCIKGNHAKGWFEIVCNIPPSHNDLLSYMVIN